jgi:hypothetical protein
LREEVKIVPGVMITFLRERMKKVQGNDEDI